MYGETPENLFYYLTVYNEPISQPAEPAGVDVHGILKGIHHIAAAGAEPGPHARCSPAAWLSRGRSRLDACSLPNGGAGGRVVGDLVERTAPRWAGV